MERSNRLKELRTRAGLSCNKLGLKVGLTGHHIWRIEMGRSGTTIATALAIAQALRVDLDELFPVAQEAPA